MTTQQLEEEMLSNPVRSLQYMLRRLSSKYPFLPQLAVDGVFGERTLEAVMLFQRELAPPVTGVVDQRTWNAIRDAWIDLERETAPPRTLRIFPGEGYQVQARYVRRRHGPAPDHVPAAAPAAGGDRRGGSPTGSTGTPPCKIPCGCRTWPSWSRPG